MKLERVEVERYWIPLSRPMEDAIHGVQAGFSLIVVKLEDSDGASGMGYTYCVGDTGAGAITGVLCDELAPLLLQEEFGGIEAVWQKMWWALHYVGRGGIAVFAMSAIDAALWDLNARRAGQPLWRMLGGCRDRVEAYGGGIDFDLSIDELLQQTQGFLDAGLRAIKIKIGRESIMEDQERIAAVREFLGADKKLMVDVNMKWSVEKAIRAARAFESLDLYWIEEPTIPDDYEGHARIEAEGGIPVATGENLHSLYEFRQMIVEGGIAFPDIDISNVGGISTWLKVAHLAEAFNRPVTTHGIQEMHVHCLAGVSNASLLEMHAFRVDDFLVHPLQIEDGFVLAPERLGHGVEFDWDALQPHRIA